MAQDALVALETLHCFQEDDRNEGSEPYIWPVLIRIDDLTLQTPGLVQISAPSPANARVIIKDSMLAGEDADIPATVGLLSARLEDNLFETRLILIVALWENDDTPEDALTAGYQAFVGGLADALGNIFTLLDLKEAEDALEKAQEDLKKAQEANDSAAIQMAQAALQQAETQKAAIIQSIKDKVKDRVQSAIADNLTVWEKAEVFFGTLNLDDLIDTDFKSFHQALPAPFSLSFGKDTSNAFEIRGQLTIKEVPVEHCQAEVDAVKSAQAAVDNVNLTIKELQEELKHASGTEKPAIIKEIARLRKEDLAAAQAVLSQALTSLSICRARVPSVPPTDTHQLQSVH